MFGNTNGKHYHERDDKLVFWVYIFKIAQKGALYSVMDEDDEPVWENYLDHGKLCAYV